MKDPLALRYRLTEELWRQFYAAHYDGDHALKVRYAWGAACIAIGAFGLGGLFESRVVALALLLTGFYGVLSKQIFLIRSVNSARKNPRFRKEISVVVTEEGIDVETGGQGYRHAWSDFTGYRKAEVGYMLYLGPASFFFIPNSAIPPGGERRIERCIATARLERIGGR